MPKYLTPRVRRRPSEDSESEPENENSELLASIATSTSTAQILTELPDDENDFNDHGQDRVTRMTCHKLSEGAWEFIAFAGKRQLFEVRLIPDRDQVVRACERTSEALYEVGVGTVKIKRVAHCLLSFFESMAKTAIVTWTWLPKHAVSAFIALIVYLGLCLVGGNRLKERWLRVVERICTALQLLSIAASVVHVAQAAVLATSLTSTPLALSAYTILSIPSTMTFGFYFLQSRKDRPDFRRKFNENLREPSLALTAAPWRYLRGLLASLAAASWSSELSVDLCHQDLYLT